MTKTTSTSRTLRARTRAVRGGLERSQHGETSEALYLTSGFAYPDAGSAERRFRISMMPRVSSRERVVWVR